MNTGKLSKIKVFLSLVVFGIVLSSTSYAHCPLCTAGAWAAGAIAVWFGVSPVIVALFIWAFAMTLGVWFARIIKKRYISYQKIIIAASIYFVTVLTTVPFIWGHVVPFYVSLYWDYGSWLHSTYSINLVWIWALLGGWIIFLGAFLNKKIKKAELLAVPFQKIIITLILLSVFALLLHLVL